MKIHIIPSAYMTDDADANMIVSMKTYNELMKSKEKWQMQFWGYTDNAEDNFRLIYEAWGIPYPEGQRYPIPETKIVFKKRSEGEERG